MNLKQEEHDKKLYKYDLFLNQRSEEIRELKEENEASKHGLYKMKLEM